MRLFVAVTPPAAPLGELDAALAPLRASRPELRWTSSRSWHITLSFLGEVDEPAAARLAARLGRAAARQAGLELTMAGGGAFPSIARARVLWTGIQGDRQALRRIAGSVAAQSGKAGAPPPDPGRRFRPHITVARCREPADAGSLVARLAGYAGSPWIADRIHLIRSHLGPEPWYESIGSWPLGSPASP